MFDRIEIEGPDFPRGRQYGARAARAIRGNVESYLDLVRSLTGLSTKEALEASASYLPLLEAHTPHLLHEMRGIAEGAGCGLDELLLLNVRSELLANADECTALAVAPEVSEGGHVLLAQNWDWYTALEPDPILLHIRQAGKPDILTLTEAGQVAKIGLNSAGLGLCLNFLGHSHRGHGLPIHVILRSMLECPGLGEAVHAAYSVPRGGSANVLLAHAEGEILDLELTATDADFLYPEGGWLVHANHFESPRLRAGDTGLLTSMSTLVRAARARRLLANAVAGHHASLDTFGNILRDHAHGAYAICRHPDPSEPALEQTATRASVLMDLTGRTLNLASGQPCCHEYRAYSLEPASLLSHP